MSTQSIHSRGMFQVCYHLIYFNASLFALYLIVNAIKFGPTFLIYLSASFILLVLWQTSKAIKTVETKPRKVSAIQAGTKQGPQQEPLRGSEQDGAIAAATTDFNNIGRMW